MRRVPCTWLIMMMMHMLELLTRKLELAVVCMDVILSESCDGSAVFTLMSMSTDLVWICLVLVLVQASERPISSSFESESFRDPECPCLVDLYLYLYRSGRPQLSTFNIDLAP